MLKLNQKKLSYTFDRCQQCGMCYAVCPENAISLSLRHDGLHDIKINAALCIACGKCVRSCPANKEYGYEGYFDGFAQKKYYLGYHADNRIRRESSSGGVCKTLIIDSLKNGMVDGAFKASHESILLEVGLFSFGRLRLMRLWPVQAPTASVPPLICQLSRS